MPRLDISTEFIELNKAVAAFFAATADPDIFDPIINYHQANLRRKFAKLYWASE